MPKSKHGECPLCQRSTALTFHHLIPRKVHRRAHFKKHYGKATLNNGIDICRTCHNGVHRHHDEMTLAKHYASLEALQADPSLARFFNWAAKQRLRS